MTRARIALTGIGVVCGLGHDPDTFGDALVDGRSAVAPVTRFDVSSCRSRLAAELADFDPAQYIDPAKLRRIDDVSSLAIATSGLALRDAGIEVSDDNRHGIGIVLGSYTAGLDPTADYLEGLMLRGPMYVTPLIFSNTVGNAPASLCGIELSLRGPNVSVNQKEASSFGAIAYAVELLRTGKAEALLAGGVDRLMHLFYRVYDSFRALSPGESGDGDEAARPFDRRRNGIVLGEGGYVLVFEPTERARARGARIHAEVLGVGAATAPAGRNAWPDRDEGLVRAMELALREGGCEAREVDWLLAAANGTETLDRVEASAIARLFGEGGVRVASVKGALGESSAAGAASLAAAALALPRGKVLPTVGFGEPAADCRSVDVSPRARDARAETVTVLVNDVGTGGTVYSILLRTNPS